MTSSTILLSERVNSWADDGSAGVAETRSAVVLSRLSAEQVLEARALAAAAGLAAEFKDEANEILDEEPDDDFGPFIATIRKPERLAHRQALTVAGFREFLAAPGDDHLCEVAFLHEEFATEAAHFVPWGHSTEVADPLPHRKNPRDIVREGAEPRLTPSDLRPWLLREGNVATLWIDRAFAEWSSLAAIATCRALASEVAGPASLFFQGPPRMRQTVSLDSFSQDLGPAGFCALQRLATWVFETAGTAEQRHAMMASELARLLPPGLPFAVALRDAAPDVLDGARLAFQLSQTDISREALRAQADLRKSIGDDTAKVADSTRTLAGALTLAMATGLGLIVTRAVSGAQADVMGWAAVIAAIYVLAVAGSGWLYLSNQKALRAQWRGRFYRFIPKDDYEAMVTKPVRDAERPYHVIGAVAVLVALFLAGLALHLIRG